MSENKPREFWLEIGNPYKGTDDIIWIKRPKFVKFETGENVFNASAIHVVEAYAFDQLKTELAARDAEVQHWKGKYNCSPDEEIFKDAVEKYREVCDKASNQEFENNKLQLILPKLREALAARDAEIAELKEQHGSFVCIDKIDRLMNENAALKARLK